MTQNTAELYSETVVNILNDKVKLKELKEQCGRYADKYTIENMVSNFVDGIMTILENN